MKRMKSFDLSISSASKLDPCHADSASHVMEKAPRKKFRPSINARTVDRPADKSGDLLQASHPCFGTWLSGQPLLSRQKHKHPRQVRSRTRKMHTPLRKGVDAVNMTCPARHVAAPHAIAPNEAAGFRQEIRSIIAGRSSRRFTLWTTLIGLTCFGVVGVGLKSGLVASTFCAWFSWSCEGVPKPSSYTSGFQSQNICEMRIDHRARCVRDAIPYQAIQGIPSELTAMTRMISAQEATDGK